jgi:hypothetical protein
MSKMDGKITLSVLFSLVVIAMTVAALSAVSAPTAQAQGDEPLIIPASATAEFSRELVYTEGTCASSWWYGGSWVASTYDKCSTYLTCLFSFKGKYHCVRTCASKYDSSGYCGTDCWDNCSRDGCC